MFTLIQRPKIIQPGNLSGRSLANAKIVKADTVLIKVRVGGDTTGATVNFTGRLFTDPLKSVVIQKSSATASEIQVDVVSPGLYSDITIHLASSDTASLDPNTQIEYDFQLTDDISYGGSSGAEVTISGATSTLEIGRFSIIDQITI